jgi:hypothetical protein
MMNVERNARGMNTAITHQKATGVMPLTYCNDIITAACTVGPGLIYVADTESWELLKIHAVPLLRRKGKGTEGLQKMLYGIDAEKEAVMLPVQVRRLACPYTIKEGRQKGVISAS